jgi:hypothetical protein
VPTSVKLLRSILVLRPAPASPERVGPASLALARPIDASVSGVSPWGASVLVQLDV